MVFARRSTTLLAAIIASCAMVLSLTACTSDNKTVVDGQTTVTSNSAGGVAVFTPSDGITLNQQTPLNKWAKLVPDLAKALADAGFKKRRYRSYDVRLVGQAKPRHPRLCGRSSFE